LGILVPPGDVTALAQAVEYMLENHRRYSGEKASSYAAGRFSREAVGRRLTEVYQIAAAAK
jgi:glycosyltransferase involved in cell wall biosynthesis